VSGAEHLHAGDVLAGRYRIERILGRGAMGLVLRALDLERGEVCAVKLLTPQALGHPTAVARFLREARAVGSLKSPHVVRVLDVGALDDGAPFMVLEPLEGADLSAVLQRRGALPAYEAARHVIEACEALAEAHAAGIVHRDLKPQNLFLATLEDGATVLKVIDFGLAKAFAQLEGESDLTLSNTVLGSPSYMSPEQIRSARSVDARSDVWSLGVVLYVLVTGKLPFAAATASDVVNAVVSAAPAPPSSLRPGLPLALDAVILRCLEKDPARRFSSAAALGAALAPFVPAAPAAPDPGEAARHRRLGLLAITLGCGLFVAIALVALALR
jgi:serine/threonine-protein kinase